MQTSFFFGYMGIVSYAFFLMLGEQCTDWGPVGGWPAHLQCTVRSGWALLCTGFVGWRASLAFVRRIYREIKLE